MKRLIRPAHLLALFAIALAFSCASPQRTPSQALRPETFGETIRIACVGDSITYGAGIKGRETNNYPVVLGTLLGTNFTTRNFGVSGATLLKQGDKPYWNQPAFAAATAYAPHAVVIKLGTNDSKPQNWKHGAEFADDLAALIDHFRALPTRPKIWLCLPVPVYATRWGIREAVVKGEIIPIIQRVAEDKAVPVINLYAALSDRPDLFPDNIHPNAAGARLMAEVIAQALTSTP